MNEKLLAMLRLLHTRDKKHTEQMRLINLVELFSKMACTELRDRIYGLLGLAYDIRPYVEADDSSDLIEKDLRRTYLEPDNSFKPPARTGLFKVDYSRSYFDIWSGVVRFAYSNADRVENQINDLQEVLSQKVEEELAHSNHGKVSPRLVSPLSVESDQNQATIEAPTIRAIGCICGRITQLGPEYKSLVGSVQAQEEWADCFYRADRNPSDLELLRKINEKYIAKILDYEDTDLTRIQEIRDPVVVVCYGQPPAATNPKASIPIILPSMTGRFSSKINMTTSPKTQEDQESASARLNLSLLFLRRRR